MQASQAARLVNTWEKSSASLFTSFAACIDGIVVTTHMTTSYLGSSLGASLGAACNGIRIALARGQNLRTQNDFTDDKIVHY